MTRNKFEMMTLPLTTSPELILSTGFRSSVRNILRGAEDEKKACVFIFSLSPVLD